MLNCAYISHYKHYLYIIIFYFFYSRYGVSHCSSHIESQRESAGR